MKSGTRRVVGWILAATLSCVFATGARAEERLVDQYNQPVPARRLSGHWLLVYFGYTQCHDVCPAALTRMKTVLTRLESSGSTVIPVFITLDPSNDTPARLREFADRFNPRLLALTGSSAAIADAASRFGVVWHPTGNRSDVDHTALWYLVSPDSRVVRMIYPTQSPGEIGAAIRAALADQH
jgi:cytochrome oxidase Cu insertion factor (SCO1/SenC/PrrC family)